MAYAFLAETVHVADTCDGPMETEDAEESYEVDDVFVKFASSFNRRSSEETTVAVLLIMVLTFVLIVVVYFYTRNQASCEQEKMRQFKRGVNDLGRMQTCYEEKIRTIEQRHRDELREKGYQHTNETNALAEEYEKSTQELASLLYREQQECEKFKRLYGEKERACQELMEKENRLGQDLAETRNRLREKQRLVETLRVEKNELFIRLQEERAKKEKPKFSISTGPGPVGQYGPTSGPQAQAMYRPSINSTSSANRGITEAEPLSSNHHASKFSKAKPKAKSWSLFSSKSKEAVAKASDTVDHGSAQPDLLSYVDSSSPDDNSQAYPDDYQWTYLAGDQYYDSMLNYN